LKLLNLRILLFHTKDYNEITSEGVKNLGKLLSNDTIIEFLFGIFRFFIKKAANKIGDEGAEIISFGIVNNNSIKILDLSIFMFFNYIDGDEISHKGAAFIGAALKNNRSLCELNLCILIL